MACNHGVRTFPLDNTVVKKCIGTATLPLQKTEKIPTRIVYMEYMNVKNFIYHYFLFVRTQNRRHDHFESMKSILCAICGCKRCIV